MILSLIDFNSYSFYTLHHPYSSVLYNNMHKKFDYIKLINEVQDYKFIKLLIIVKLTYC